MVMMFLDADLVIIICRSRLYPATSPVTAMTAPHGYNRATSPIFFPAYRRFGAAIRVEKQSEDIGVL